MPLPFHVILQTRALAGLTGQGNTQSLESKALTFWG